MKSTSKMTKALFGGGVIFFFISLLYFPFVSSAFAVTLEPGDLIVADFNGAFGGPIGTPAGGRIIKVDSGTGAQTMISSGNLLDAPYDVAIDAAGNIIVLDKDTSVAGQIIKVNPADGSQTVISEGGLFVNPMGIAIDAAGSIIVADQLSGGTGGILKVDPVTGAQTVLSSGNPLDYPGDVTIDGAGDIYVASQGSCCGYLDIIMVDPANGNKTVISSGTLTTWFSGIVIDDTADNIFVGEIYYYNGIIKVDPATGAQTLLANGSPFQDPYQLDIDLAGNLVVADSGWWGIGSIIKVDPTSGAKTVISSGGLLVDPAGIVVFEEVNQLLAAIESVQNVETVITSLGSDPEVPIEDILKNANMQNALLNKLNAVIADIEAGNYADVLAKLQNDILKKTDGCANSGAPDKNDWVKDCDSQAIIYQAILDAITMVEALL